MNAIEKYALQTMYGEELVNKLEDLFTDIGNESLAIEYLLGLTDKPDCPSTTCNPEILKGKQDVQLMSYSMTADRVKYSYVQMLNRSVWAVNESDVIDSYDDKSVLSTRDEEKPSPNHKSVTIYSKVSKDYRDTTTCSLKTWLKTN